MKQCCQPKSNHWRTKAGSLKEQGQARYLSAVSRAAAKRHTCSGETDSAQ